MACSPCPDGVIVHVRLTPNAPADRLEGIVRDSSGRSHVSARVRAVPEDGKANKALAALLAAHCGVAKSAVSLQAGAKSRMKKLHVAGDPASLAAAFERLA